MLHRKDIRICPHCLKEVEFTLDNNYMYECCNCLYTSHNLPEEK